VLSDRVIAAAILKVDPLLRTERCIEGVTGLLHRAKISPVTRRAAQETTETVPQCRV
jgi:hypothetical protein